MKTLFYIFLLILICSTAFADKFLVEKKDGSVIVWNYYDDSRLMNDKAKELGYDGLQIIPVSDSDFPNADQKYWRMSHVPVGQKILIDTVSQQADIDAQNQKQTKKTNSLKKICPSCNAQDLQDLLS